MRSAESQGRPDQVFHPTRFPGGMMEENQAVCGIATTPTPGRAKRDGAIRVVFLLRSADIPGGLVRPLRIWENPLDPASPVSPPSRRGSAMTLRSNRLYRSFLL